MKFLKYTWAMCLATILSLGFSACSDNDNNEPQQPVEIPESGDFTNEVDGAAYAQSQIALYNEDGTLKQRISGVALDPAHPEVLSIAVKNEAEAREFFDNMVPPAQKSLLTEQADGSMVYSPVDVIGIGQGSIYYTPATEDKRMYAEITYSDDCPLRGFKSLQILKRSAWPLNESTQYFPGEEVTASSNVGQVKEGNAKWICVKSAEPGRAGWLMRITSGSYKIDYKDDEWYACATRSQADELVNLIKKDPSWKEYFAAAGMPVNDQETWIQDSHGVLIFIGVHRYFPATINLTNGNIDWHDSITRNAHRKLLLFKTFGMVND